jgi:signal transduction histidine kinase
MTTAAVVAGLMAAWAVAGPPAGSLLPWLVSLVAIYAVAQEGDGVRAIAGAAVVLASNWLLTLIATNGFVDYVFVTVFAAGAWAAGRAVHTRQLRARRAAAEAARLAEESDRIALAAVAEERQRIARELHDVVAHNVGVIVVQAQATTGMLDRDAIDARRAVELIERMGREALGEMRRMLGLMRDADAGDRADPLPSLRQLDRLAADVRAPQACPWQSTFAAASGRFRPALTRPPTESCRKA